MKQTFVLATVLATGILRAATVDLADVLDEGSTTWTVTDLSAGDAYVYDGAATVDLVFDLAADASYTGAVSVSGNVRLVKRGAGVLGLTAANGYTGGTSIEKGILAVSDPGALGSGKVSISAAASDSAPCRLRIDAAMTFANDIEVSGGFACSGSADTGAAKFFARACIDLDAAAAVELSGDIVSTCDLYLWDKKKNVNRTFSGFVSAEGCHIVASPYNSLYVFSGGVKAAAFYATYVYLHMNSVRFEAESVDVDKLVVAYTKAEAYDVFGEGTVLRHEGSADPVRSVFSLRDDVTLGGWTTEKKDNAGKLQYPIRCLPAAEPRTLTLRASASGVSYGSLRDHVNFVYDPVSPTCTQTLTATSQRTHDTKGSIVVKGGTLALTGYVSFPGVPSVTVEDGASLVVDTQGTAALAGLTSVSVGAGAEFFCAGATTDPFSPGVIRFDLASGCSVSLPAGETLSLAELWRDGVRLAGGRYTPDGAGGTKVLAELKSGTLYVPEFAGETETSVWQGTAGSAIGSAENWTGGTLPDWESIGAELVFAAEGCQSTSAVFQEPVDVKRIVFRQPLGFTLGASGDGRIKLLEGVVFGDIGTAASDYTLDVPVQIVGDQTWALPADEAGVFTVRKPFLSDPEAGGEMLYITNDVGTLNLHMTNSTYLGSLYAQAKTMNISGENVFGPADAGGTVTLKLNHHENTASCRFLGCTVEKPVTCSMVSKGVNYYILSFAAGTTNVFNGHVHLPAWTDFEKGSYTEFNGGVRVDAYNRQRLREGAVVVFRGGTLDYRDNGGHHGMSPLTADGEKATMVFDCVVAIDASEWMDVSGTLTFDMRRDYALSAGKWAMKGIMQLNGHPQGATRSAGSTGRVSSTNVPAFVELALPAGVTETNALRFTDLAGFRMTGAGCVRLNGVSTSAGTLAVESGTLELGDATWLNATNVAVSGSGVLRLTKERAFDGRVAALALAGDGTIDVPAGVDQRFASATVTLDGEEKKVPAGTYGAGASGLMAGRVTGGGTVTVVSKALLLIVR